MAGLTGKTIATTYNSLLRTFADGGITASLQVLEDGAGDNTCLQLSTKQFLVKSATDIAATFDIQNSAGHQIFTVNTLSNPEEVVINEGGLATVDFRVESDTNQNALFVDSTGKGQVGIGLTPSSSLHVFSADNPVIANFRCDNTTAADYMCLRMTGLETDDSNDTVYCDWFFDPTTETYGFGEGTAASGLPGGETGDGAALTNADIYVDSDGDVGIGTYIANLSSRLTLAGTSAGADQGAVLTFHRVDQDIANGATIGEINFRGDDPSGNTQTCARIQVTATADWGDDSTDSPCYMRFFTSPDGDDHVEAMRIDSTGFIGLYNGSMTPTHKLHVRGGGDANYVALFDNSGTGSDAHGIIIKAGDTNHSNDALTHYIQFLESDGGIVGDLDNSAGSGALILNTASDERLKENIKNTEVDGLNIINNLTLREFNWKKRYNKKVEKCGLIAQEVQKVLPSAVNEMGDEDKTLAIVQTGFVYSLIKAVQELSTKVTALENA